MTPRLRQYLELERLMLIFDEAGEPGADALRDAMDPIWYSLAPEERRLLDDRTIGRLASLEEIRVPADQVFGLAPASVARRELPGEPIEDWLTAE